MSLSNTYKKNIILWELHEGVRGGNFVLDITTKKIIDAGYWCVTLFKDVLEYY
jgi:hypothetical protein